MRSYIQFRNVPQRVPQKLRNLMDDELIDRLYLAASIAFESKGWRPQAVSEPTTVALLAAHGFGRLEALREAAAIADAQVGKWYLAAAAIRARIT